MIHQTTTYPSSAQWSSLSRQRQQSWEQAIESAMLSDWFKSMTPPLPTSNENDAVHKDASAKMMNHDGTTAHNGSLLSHHQHLTHAPVLHRPSVYLASATNVQLHDSDSLEPVSHDSPHVAMGDKIRLSPTNADVSLPLNGDVGAATERTISSVVQWQPHSSSTPSSEKKNSTSSIAAIHSLRAVQPSGMIQETINGHGLSIKASSPQRNPRSSVLGTVESASGFPYEPTHDRPQQYALHYTFKSDKSVRISKLPSDHAQFDPLLLKNDFSDRSDTQISFHEKNGLLKIWLGLSYTRLSEINGMIETLQQWVKEKKYTLLSITVNGQEIQMSDFSFQGLFYGNYPYR